MRLGLAALTLAACGGAGAAPDAAGEPPPDAAPSRSYAMAVSGARLDPSRGFRLGPANVAEDADVSSIYQDFYGVPWDYFQGGFEPPLQWAATMRELADTARLAGQPVFLSLALVAGKGRHFLSPRVGLSGNNVVLIDMTDECYDFATASDGAAKRTAYLAYVAWMVALFEPTWVDTAIELNDFEDCPSWPAMVEVANAAYDTAKATKPDVIAFPSIQLEALYAGDYDANYAGLADLSRDRFAVSSYPTDDVPADHLTRAADRGGEALLIAETGWLASPLVATDATGTCATVHDGDPDREAAWLDQVLAAASARDADLVTWFSDRDLVPVDVMTDCPCDFDVTWCNLLGYYRSQAGSDPAAQLDAEVAIKRRGAMGLRLFDRSEREPVMSRWRQARALPHR